MCTAISFLSSNHYFGRTLDLEYHYNEMVTVTPRQYRFEFCRLGRLETHYAIIGMATVADNYPLYYEATNEKGLSVAGLNFPGNAIYYPEKNGFDNVAPFELIPWILSKCANLWEARQSLKRINLINTPFSANYPLFPLHWLIADRDAAIVVEQTSDGLHVYDNTMGVLTNNPPFPYHLANVANYQNITSEEPVNRFCRTLKFDTYSRGMGGIGLPGDLSSSSRFVRAAFVKLNSVCNKDEESSVSQFFHIMGAVEQQRGCAQVGNDYEITVYTSCCNTDRGIYYYTTYENRQITAVDMHRENLDGDCLILHKLNDTQQIFHQN